MRKTTIFVLLAVLCLVLAGCQNTKPAPEAGPASQNEPETSAQDVSQPETTPEQGEDPTPEAEPEPEEPQDVQPVEPSLPEPTESENDGSDSFVGDWRNDSPGSVSNGRCRMEIDCEDGVNYGIYIRWGCSSATDRYWVYTGTYDEAQGGIAYTGYSFYGETQFDGSIKKSEERENLEGLIRLEDGVLYWEDTVDHAGEEMGFNRIKES